MPIEHVGVESPCEESAPVPVWLGDEDQYIREACLLNPHREIVA